MQLNFIQDIALTVMLIAIALIAILLLIGIAADLLKNAFIVYHQWKQYKNR